MDNKNSNVEDDAEAASSERLLEPNQAQNSNSSSSSSNSEQGRKLHSKTILGKTFSRFKRVHVLLRRRKKRIPGTQGKKEIRLSPAQGFYFNYTRRRAEGLSNLILFRSSFLGDTEILPPKAKKKSYLHRNSDQFVRPKRHAPYTHVYARSVLRQIREIVRPSVHAFVKSFFCLHSPFPSSSSSFSLFMTPEQTSWQEEEEEGL